MMTDHSHYEELAALAAGSQLTGEELTDFQRHAETCAECKRAFAEFQAIVHLGLPLTESPFRQRMNILTSRPDPGATERFIRRASLEGIAFSPELRKAPSSSRPRFLLAGATACALAAIVSVVFILSHPRGASGPQLSNQPSAPEATVARLEQTNAEQQRELDDLRNQLATLSAVSGSQPADRHPSPTNATQAASHDAGTAVATQAQENTQEKELEETKAELAALKKARASDYASIVADQVEIKDLSNELKTAKANAANTQSQLATAGGDVSGVMGARHLHVVDVRDAGPDGKPGKAFGRVFLTEGKSLVFYAFDLDNSGKKNSRKTYQVWGETGAGAGSLRSLGFLNVDSKSQQRWVLKSNDAAAFKQINSLFVTEEPQGGASKPSGQRMLFAYLGEANHP
jgi:hypothetical protein